MYKKINITETTLRVLAAFTSAHEYYIREIQRNLKVSPRTAQLTLEDLEKKGILQSKTRGKIKTYQLRQNHQARTYLVFAEQYKTLAFLTHNPLIKEIIEHISPHIQGIGIIFGSYAKQTQTKHSDLDIFVAGTYSKPKIQHVSKTWGIHISVKNYPLNVFKKNIHKDFLLNEIIKHHVVFLNAEQFVELTHEQDPLVQKEARRFTPR